MIKLILLDVDGTLTDGGIYLGNSGEELKKFNVKDGYAIVNVPKLGIEFGIIKMKNALYKPILVDSFSLHNNSNSSFFFFFFF